MLSEAMTAELDYVSAMLFHGVLTALCYHGLILFRTIWHHAASVIDAEDILFFLAAGFSFFLVTYEKNDGILRWYAFMGFGLGIYAYSKTLGALLEKGRKWLLQKRKKPFKIKHSKKIKKGKVSEDETSNPTGIRKRKKERL